MEFYDTVTEKNAKVWYNDLPTHLRKQVDDKLGEYTKADHFQIQKLDPDLEKETTKKMGCPIPAVVIVNNTPDGNTVEEVERFDKRKAWCQKYNEILLVNVVVSMAPRIQKERKMLSEALGIANSGDLPNQAEGLDDTQAATVRWIQATGQTPLEFLAATYRDPAVRTGDRIQAARAMLDFVHRKVPQQVEVKGPSKEEINEHAEAVRDIGEQLARLVTLERKKG